MVFTYPAVKEPAEGEGAWPGAAGDWPDNTAGCYDMTEGRWKQPVLTGPP